MGLCEEDHLLHYYRKHVWYLTDLGQKIFQKGYAQKLHNATK